ncbi:MAG: Crp/Fnr family transcriptional regulator [Halobacteriovoraceae bacterium]|nr:Crp/Fnr family transcriptional regulator [Halobacteriovoraceae bacterium]MCB9095303.1 Crp/Fnr family transcriptional regulator [Halobacteriovoraceae bacterium]
MFYQILKPHVQESREHHFKRGEIIYHEGDTPQNIYFIESGLVGLFHIAESGKETFLRVFGTNSILGHRSYFANEPYHATAIALAPSLLISITKEECSRICRESPSLLKEVTSQLAKDLKTAELRMAGLQDKSVHQRIAESLVFLKLKHPDHTWTRKEIAEYSGSTFETVARAMSLFEKEGLIKKQGRDFEIFDPQKLIAFTNSEN